VVCKTRRTKSQADERMAPMLPLERSDDSYQGGALRGAGPAAAGGGNKMIAYKCCPSKFAGRHML